MCFSVKNEISRLAGSPSPEAGEGDGGRVENPPRNRDEVSAQPEAGERHRTSRRVAWEWGLGRLARSDTESPSTARKIALQRFSKELVGASCRGPHPTIRGNSTRCPSPSQERGRAFSSMRSRSCISRSLSREGEGYRADSPCSGRVRSAWERDGKALGGAREGVSEWLDWRSLNPRCRGA